MGEISRDDRKRFLQDRNAKAVYHRNLGAGGFADAANRLSFVPDDDAGRFVRDEMYRRLREVPGENRLADRPAALDLAAAWLRNREGEMFCLVPAAGVLIGATRTFLDNFDRFDFLGGASSPDIVFASPSFDSGVACEYFHGEFFGSTWG